MMSDSEPELPQVKKTRARPEPQAQPSRPSKAPRDANTQNTEENELMMLMGLSSNNPPPKTPVPAKTTPSPARAPVATIPRAVESKVEKVAPANTSIDLENLPTSPEACEEMMKKCQKQALEYSRLKDMANARLQMVCTYMCVFIDCSL